ncbi:MAG: acyl-CoA dehydrogenase family protein [Deltaproteobacteria bacterium]|nr:acyl-CoA dehydrogenase family protein [Deltaproteobacteria bacterium]
MSELPKGGSFLVQSTDPKSVFTPEDFTEEHRMIETTVSRFVNDRVLTRIDELESQREGLIRELLGEAGELGLLGAEIPEQYDGMAMDKISSTILAEGMGRAGSFAMTQGGQTGIGSLPIVFFGNHDQKSRYLPGIVTGELIGAYALTEPGAGSDALSIKTKAVLSPDGKHYILNGAKQFITNAGMADIFIIYAKIDGDKFSTFIVDGNSEGLSLGLEEKKMGIKGSSTRTVVLEDVKVPVENLLFEIGRGHVVAFNILNLGRYKLAGNAVGNAKFALELSAGYANERRQFNVPIAEFGLIKEKLAEMATRIYVAESMLYRTGGLIEDIMHSVDTTGPDGGRVAAQAIEEYALECSLNKVFATEMLAHLVDEGVQIHGGYGVIAEYPIERLYRDARVYRIFEGTNEINRVLIPTLLIRKSGKGDLPLMDAVAQLRHRLESEVAVGENAGDLVQAARDIFLLVLGTAWEKLGQKLLKQQEILGRLADLTIAVFGMESSWLRAQKALTRDGEDGAKRITNLAQAFIYATLPRLEVIAGEVLFALANGPELTALQSALHKLVQYTPIDLIGLRQAIAAEISEAGKYIV